MTQVNTDYPGIPQFQDVPFVAADYGATLSMTWIVGAGDVSLYRAARQGTLLSLWLNLATTTVGGTVAGANLTVKLPFGLVAAKSAVFNAIASPGGGAVEGVFVTSTAGSNLLTVVRYASSWVLGSDNTGVAFSIQLEVQ